MGKIGLMAAACGLALLGAEAKAQTAPDNGDHILVLDQVFREFDPTASPPVVVTYEDVSSYDDVANARNFLDDGYLSQKYPHIYQGTEFVRGAMNYRGLLIEGTLQSFTQPTFSHAEIYLDIPSILGYSTMNGSSGPPPPGQQRTLFYDHPSADAQGFESKQNGCGEFLYAVEQAPTQVGPLRHGVHDLYVHSLEEGPLGLCLQRGSAARSAIDPLAGNPDSLQMAILRDGLDLDALDIEDDPIRMGAENDPELIGVAVNHFSSGGFGGERYDLRVQKAWRPFESNRMRLLIDAPVSFITVDGATSIQGHVSLSLDVPVIAKRWTLTPRASFGMTSADNLGGDGEMWALSLTSRYRLPDIGRGTLIVGNMVAYTSTTDTGISGAKFNPGIINWAFRNGIAYQFPIHARFMGRATSWRASYTFNNLVGSDLFLDQYHEFTLNFGIRGREDSPRTGVEVIRIGLTGIFGHDYNSVGLSAGFRF